MRRTRLPFTLTPLPGEPFSLWWHSYASRMRVTGRELAHAVGIATDTPPRLEHTELIASATGLPTATIGALFDSTRPCPPAHVLRVWTALAQPDRRRCMPATVTALLDQLRDRAATPDVRGQAQAKLTDLTLIALHLTQPGIERLRGFTHQLPEPAAFTTAIELRSSINTQDRLAAMIGQPSGHNTPAVPFSWRTASPALQARIARSRDADLSTADRLRYTTTLPQSVPRPWCRRDPAVARAARLPDQIWSSWALRLVDDDFINNTVFRAAMSVGLLLPHSSERMGELGAMLPAHLDGPSVGHQLRRLAETPHGTAALQILTELALALDQRGVPIDYPRRRTLTATAELIDEPSWQRYCRGAQLRPGHSRRLAHARRYLYELLTGDSLSYAPPPYRLPTGTARIDYVDFWAALPADLVSVLHSHAERLLTAAGITDEPVTWEPPAHWVSITRWPGTDPNQTDPAPIHRALSRQWVTVEDHWNPSHATADSLGISLGHLRHVLHRHPIAEAPYPPHRAGAVIAITSRGGPAHRSLTRPTSQKPIFQLDPAWLGEQLDWGRSLKHVATEIGCTRNALRKFAVGQHIPIRARSGGTTCIPTHTLTGHPAQLPDLLRAALTGRQSLGRLERFLLITRHPSLNQAALSANIHASALTMQLHGLERACGGPLFHRRPHPQPLGPLTPLGEQLCQQAREHLTLTS